MKQMHYVVIFTKQVNKLITDAIFEPSQLMLRRTFVSIRHSHVTGLPITSEC